MTVYILTIDFHKIKLNYWKSLVSVLYLKHHPGFTMRHQTFLRVTVCEYYWKPIEGSISLGLTCCRGMCIREMVFYHCLQYVVLKLPVLPFILVVKYD